MENANGWRDPADIGAASWHRDDPTEADGVAGEAMLRMCHDLVTPAVTIRHLAEVIAAEPGISAEIRRRASLIAAESTTISDICAFALNVARASSPVRLDRVVSECVTSARSWFRGTIEEKLDDVTIAAPHVQMLRLVSNLLSNACRAAGPGGEVRITLGHDGTVAHLEVTNTGASLEPALLIGPDDSGNPSTLGLRIIMGILTDYHGHVHIEPGLLGGTTMQVELPLDGIGDGSTTALI
jgi:signal transduction histidine kinase